MKKIYGYKEQDVIGLAQLIKDKGNRSLSQVFESYAIKSNKAKGTVRNLYYAMAKLSNQDSEFCNKYLGGQKLCVEKIVEFGLTDENELIRKVLIGKKEGRSVRSVIMEMAGGDGKIALRYQNKYRNAVKFKPDMVTKIISEIKGDEELLYSNNKSKHQNLKNSAVAKMIEKITRDIDCAISNSNFELQKENQSLKEKVSFLEEENKRLNALLNGSKTALKIFHHVPDQSLLS